MVASIEAPISVVLKLGPHTTPQLVTDILADWLEKTYGLELVSAELDGLLVQWRIVDDDAFACLLAVSDSHAQTRRTVTVLTDNDGTLAFVEESPLVAAEGPHSLIDLTQPTQRLLSALSSLTDIPLGVSRNSVNDLECLSAEELLAWLHDDLEPGLVVAVTRKPDDEPSTVQLGLLTSLAGLAIVGHASVGSPLLKSLEPSVASRAGSVVSFSRVASGLDVTAIGGTALGRRPDSARRLLVRRHLSAPTPFDLERRRSGAMARLRAEGHQVDLSAALELLEEEGKRTSQLTNRLRELELLLEMAYEEQDEALGELDDALSQVRYLQKAFRSIGEVPIAEPDEDDDWHPSSCAEALEAARELLPFVVIGKTATPCQVLDQHRKKAIWGQKVWNSLRALNDYCRSKTDGRFAGDITSYRDNTPEGAIPLLSEYSPKESQSTTNDPKTRSARYFPVPAAVDPSGIAYMEQHIKIDRAGNPAPRIHLFDDSGGPTQRVYVGYVGPHLPTSSGF